MAAVHHSAYMKSVILRDTKLQMSKLETRMKAERCSSNQNSESTKDIDDSETEIKNEEESSKPIHDPSNDVDDENKTEQNTLNNESEIVKEQFEGHSLIADFLWIGGQDSAVDIMGMKELGINYVLNCAGGHIKLKYGIFDIELHSINALDTDDYNITQHIEECIEFIQIAKENNGKILVHCVAGMNRSAAICCAYLIFTGMSLIDAYELILNKRKLVYGLALSNEHFREQLIEFAYGMDRTGSEFSKYLRKKNPKQNVKDDASKASKQVAVDVEEDHGVETQNVL